MNKRMDSRDSSLAPIVAGVVVLVTILAAVYFLVIRDDDKDSDKPGATPAADQTFQVDRVPFTFKFPARFALAPTPQGFVWIAGVGPYDILDVKRLANNERSIKATRSETLAALEVRPDLTIRGDGTTTAGQTKMVRFEVDTNVSGQALRSTLYYFSMGGASWQLECQSTAEGRSEIDAACAQMLATFTAR